METRRNAILITVFSVISCSIYTFMLGSIYNHIFYTSLAKMGLFLLVPLLYYSLSKQGRFKDLFHLNVNKKYTKVSAWLGVATFAFIIFGFIALNKFFDRQMIINGLLNEGITPRTFL